MPGPLVGVGLNALSRLAPQIVRGTTTRGAPALQRLGTGRVGSIVRAVGGGALLGGGFEVGSNLFDGGGGGGRVVGGPVERLEPGMVFPTGEVVGKVWSTNGDFPNMAQTLDGKKGIALRNDGTVRIFRYQKHIVVSSNPRARSVARASKRLDKLMTGLVKTGTQSKRARSKTR